MKISCPNCNASGNIPDHAIPQEGRFLSCPKCKHGFTVSKPKATTETYELDACPACNYSTFGEDRFSTCPKCGVVIKAFIEKQRQEKQRVKEQELLVPKNVREPAPAPEPPRETIAQVSEIIDNMHPVNLIGWGAALAAVIILGLGIMGLMDYNANELKAQLSFQKDEQVSSWYVFRNYGLMPWLKTVYGLALLATSAFFLQHRAPALTAMTALVRALFVFVPLYLVVSFIFWILQPIPHTIGGYLIEIVNLVIMSALFCIPLYFVDNFLKDKRVVSVVKIPMKSE
jgi:predicted Zn finger-like uncharacterized protein